MEEARVSSALALVSKPALARPPIPSHKGCKSKVLTLIDTWWAAAGCAAETRGRSACRPGSGRTPSLSTCSVSLAGERTNCCCLHCGLSAPIFVDFLQDVLARWDSAQLYLDLGQVERHPHLAVPLQGHPQTCNQASPLYFLWKSSWALTHPAHLLQPDSSGEVFCLRTQVDSNCWQLDFLCSSKPSKSKSYFTTSLSSSRLKDAFNWAA